MFMIEFEPVDGQVPPPQSFDGLKTYIEAADPTQDVDAYYLSFMLTKFRKFLEEREISVKQRYNAMLQSQKFMDRVAAKETNAHPIASSSSTDLWDRLELVMRAAGSALKGFHFASLAVVGKNSGERARISFVDAADFWNSIIALDKTPQDLAAALPHKYVNGQSQSDLLREVLHLENIRILYDLVHTKMATNPQSPGLGTASMISARRQGPEETTLFSSPLPTLHR